MRIPVPESQALFSIMVPPYNLAFDLWPAWVLGVYLFSTLLCLIGSGVYLGYGTRLL